MAGNWTKKQGKIFLLKPESVLVQEEQDNREQTFRFNWKSDKDKKDKWAVILYHDESKGTSQYSEPFKLNQKQIGVLSAAELDAPAAGGDFADAGSHIMTDSIPVDAHNEEDDIEGNNMGVVGPADTGSVGGGSGPAVVSGGIGASGGVGGMKAGGCSLFSGANRTETNTTIPAIAIFSLFVSLCCYRGKNGCSTSQIIPIRQGVSRPLLFS